MKKKAINIGIIGFGNIGSSVARNLKRNSSIISERVGASVRVKLAADKSPKALKKARAMGISATRNPRDIVRDSNIDIVVETMGGENPARGIILDSISRNKHVVTSNKEVVAKHLKLILNSAKRKGVSVSFEAAVGGGTPIIGPLRDDLAGNDISLIYGIVNGTTNYILSNMFEREMEFKQALSIAINEGFAEANPRSDIEGIDSAYKAAILASVAFGADVKMRDVHVEGISKISQEDIRFAGEIGYVIKLLAVVKLVQGKLEVRVHPTLLPFSHRLASVSGPLNAIYVSGRPVGGVLLSAQGAGGDATSSAVMGDVIEIAKRIKRGDGAVSWGAPQRIKLRKIDEIKSRYYIRLRAPDRTGVLAGISKAFSDEKVSIQAVVQKENVGNVATIVILIHDVVEKNLMRAVARIKRLSVVKEVCNVIRVASA
jgi:homoserine dehydrogenase